MELLNIHDFGALVLYKYLKDKNTTRVMSPGSKSRLAYIIETFGKQHREHKRTARENMINLDFNRFQIQKIPYYQQKEHVLRHLVYSWPRSLGFIPEDLKTEEIMAEAVQNNRNAFRYVPNHMVTQKIIIALTYSAGSEVCVVYDRDLLEIQSEYWGKSTNYISDRWMNDKITRRYIIKRCLPHNIYQDEIWEMRMLGFDD